MQAQLLVTPVVSDAERRVNTTTAGSQVTPAGARLKNGGHVIAWSSPGQGVCAQRYRSDGMAVGGEVCIGAVTASDRPSVTGLPDGGYLVAWVVLNDDSSTDIKTQRYDANAAPVGTVQNVNTVTAGEQWQVAAAGLVGGGHVVTWTSHQPYDDVYARHYGADGAPTGPEVRVNTFTDINAGGRSRPVVAGLGGGGYVIAWMSQFQDPHRSVGIYAQRFSEAGSPIGGESLVSSGSDFTALDPVVVGLTGGGFVIAWTSSQPGREVVVAQRFAADGARLGAEALVDPPLPVDPPPVCFTPRPGPCRALQLQAAAAPLDDGGYVIAWLARHNPADGENIDARRFTAEGIPAGPAARVNTSAFSSHTPAVSSTGLGGFVISWSSRGPDTDASDIYARRFGAQGLRSGPAP